MPPFVRISLLTSLCLLGPAQAQTDSSPSEVEAQFRRLESKFTGNRTMQSFVASSRKDWESYRKTQCYFEKAAAAGGKVLKNPPPAAGVAFQACMQRTAAEMANALAKL
jgi:hypothetical protein